MNTFIHLETKIAFSLGLSRDDIRAMRQTHLQENVHWAYQKKRVYLTEDGLQILIAKKALPDPTLPKTPPPGANASHPRLLLGAPFKGELVAWMTTANKHILLAYFPDTDPKNRVNLVRVRVANNENFTRGMKVNASHVQADLYDLVGNCPRWRGRY